MRERIIKIMEAENLTPSLFADKLNIGRAVISHILNGRNNPSLDVVIRILDVIDYIDADWLLSGKGNMRKSDNVSQEVNSSPMPIAHVSTDLFENNDTEPTATTISQSTKNIAKEDGAQTSVSTDINPLSSITKPATILGAADKTISKVIIYYSDNTFQAFNPDSTSL